MARKTPSRLEMRKIVEAADAQDAADESTGKKKKKKKKVTKRKTRRVKAKVAPKKRLIWVVFNGSMKEESRFPYAERAAAEEKLEQLRAKSTKRLYYLQAVKEEITDAPPAEESAEG